MVNVCHWRHGWCGDRSPAENFLAVRDQFFPETKILPCLWDEGGYEGFEGGGHEGFRRERVGAC